MRTSKYIVLLLFIFLLTGCTGMLNSAVVVSPAVTNTDNLTPSVIILPEASPYVVNPSVANPSVTSPSGAVYYDTVMPYLPNEFPTDQPSATIAEFKTTFLKNPVARATNVKIASNSINGKVILPGETFSYNETVGPTTKKNGYKKAQIFIKGKKEMGYGGGVCQVSSTLYNAVLQGGFAVVERHSHSLPVSYVDKDKDAATSYGGIDFKFTNNRTYPVTIQSESDATSVTVRIVRA